jgi:hypothetical protein
MEVLLVLLGNSVEQLAHAKMWETFQLKDLLPTQELMPIKQNGLVVRNALIEQLFSHKPLQLNSVLNLSIKQRIKYVSMVMDSSLLDTIKPRLTL